MINITFVENLFSNLKHAKWIANRNGQHTDIAENLVLINLNLDHGRITDDGVGALRLQHLIADWKDYLYGVEEEEYDSCIGTDQYNLSMKSIQRIKEGVKNGEEFRVWYSNAGDEFCGLCWLMSLFNNLEAENKISVVKLPGVEYFENRTIEGKLPSEWSFPEELLSYVEKEIVATESLRIYCELQWVKAKEDDTDLRVAVNGRIISVNADFYDATIMAEVDKLGEIINETELVGNCIEKIGVSDKFIGHRIEEMIEKGIFEVVAPPERCTPFYRKTIRRTKKGLVI